MEDRCVHAEQVEMEDRCVHAEQVEIAKLLKRCKT